MATRDRQSRQDAVLTTTETTPAGGPNMREVAAGRQRSGAQSAQFTTYTVRPGDNLDKIARAHNVEGGYQTLAKLNNLRDAGDLSVGQELQIPSTVQAQPPVPQRKPEVPTTQEASPVANVAQPGTGGTPTAKVDAERAEANTTYTVRSGDTLAAIAADHNVEGGWQALAAFNGITDPGALRVGQKLQIPSGAQADGNRATGDGGGPVADGDIEWLSGKFTITHYTFALESDPKHAGSPKVSAPGLDPKEKYRQSFLGTPYGIRMQGTGLAENGKYIMYVGNGRYAYGMGGAKGNPRSWDTIAVDPSVIPHGSQVIIESYQKHGPFLANDTGGAIKGRHIDVFVGAVTIKEAYSLGTKKSRVGIQRKKG